MTNTELFDLLGHELTAVHIGVGPDFADRALALAESEGYDHRHVSLATATTPEDYYNIVGRAFEFPSAVVNDQGLIDWLSDLEWLGDFPGHVVVFEGLDGLFSNNKNLLRSLASALPAVLDGMRSGGEGFHAILVSQNPEVLDVVAAEVDEANELIVRAMQDFKSTNPSKPARLIDHRPSRQ